MKSLYKVEYCNLPVSVPVEWRDFFQDKADELGISRNAAFCMALRMGGPLLDAHVKLMRESVRDGCSKVETVKIFATSKILGAPRKCRSGVKPARARSREENRRRVKR